MEEEKNEMHYHPINVYPYFLTSEMNGISIKSTSVYSIPQGFTFIYDWEFNSSSMSTNMIILDKNKTVMNNFTIESHVFGNYEINMGVKLMFSVSLINDVKQLGTCFIGFSKPLSDTLDEPKQVILSDHGFIYTLSYKDLPTFGKNGDIIDLAIDTVDKCNFWFRVNGGPWNNKINSDPSTNTEPVIILNSSIIQ